MLITQGEQFPFCYCLQSLILLQLSAITRPSTPSVSYKRNAQHRKHPGSNNSYCWTLIELANSTLITCCTNILTKPTYIGNWRKGNPLQYILEKVSILFLNLIINSNFIIIACLTNILIHQMFNFNKNWRERNKMYYILDINTNFEFIKILKYIT